MSAHTAATQAETLTWNEEEEVKRRPSRLWRQRRLSSGGIGLVHRHAPLAGFVVEALGAALEPRHVRQDSRPSVRHNNAPHLAVLVPGRAERHSFVKEWQPTRNWLNVHHGQQRSWRTGHHGAWESTDTTKSPKAQTHQRCRVSRVAPECSFPNSVSMKNRNAECVTTAMRASGRAMIHCTEFTFERQQSCQVLGCQSPKVRVSDASASNLLSTRKLHEDV